MYSELYSALHLLLSRERLRQISFSRHLRAEMS